MGGTDYPSKRRDYYREYIKELIPLKKPFLVTGTYDPPIDIGDTHFCRFLNIKPYVFGATGKVLCSHIHITRKLAERWYDRFTIDMKGREFVLCVKPYLYEEKRGGLDLTSKLREWIEPIFPSGWYNGPLEVFSKIPEDEVLDFRFIPKRWHFLSDIASYQHAKDRGASISKPKAKKKPSKRKRQIYAPHPDEAFVPEEGRPTIEWMEKEITRVMALSKKKVGMKILAAQGIFFDSASSRLEWLSGKLKPWKWTEWEMVHLMRRIDVTPEKFAKLKKKSFRVWYEENG